MANEKQRLSPAERANLVAYIDGELNEAEARAIATKLTQSVTARRELESLEKTWELLDLLPRPQPTTEFTAKTLTLVKQLAARDDRLFSVAGRTAQHLTRVLVLALSSVLTLAIAYAATRWLWPDPTARLERELSLAEHLDEYIDIGSFDFLKLLDDSPEFKDEVSLLASGDDNATGGPAAAARLRTLPREERLVLAKNLNRFDLLSSSEQAALRTLDSQLTRLPADDRTRLMSLLQCYHLWILGLPEAKRKELAAASGDARLALVQQSRDQTRAQKGPRNAFLLTQFAWLSPISLFETSHLIKIWLNLKPEEQAKIEKTAPAERGKKLHELGPYVGVPQEKRPSVAEWDKVRKHINSKENLKKRFDALKAQAKDNQARRLMEAHYFLDNEPAPVALRKLLQFESALPSWFRDQYSLLPPEAARRRLTILYRLVFPEGQEMPEPKPKNEPGQAAAPAAGSAAFRPLARAQLPDGSGSSIF
jgi:hypothetical protein